ncbi:MAG: hypothetical protein KAF91_29065 [Nostoc sp. TH1S01]|nr:hypothetical protein [Nostoc sp. TH1S01]
MSALVTLENYKSQLPENSSEHHQVNQCIRQLKKTLIIYGGTNHCQSRYTQDTQFGLYTFDEFGTGAVNVHEDVDDERLDKHLPD